MRLGPDQFYASTPGNKEGDDPFDPPVWTCAEYEAAGGDLDQVPYDFYGTERGRLHKLVDEYRGREPERGPCAGGCGRTILRKPERLYLCVACVKEAGEI